MTSHKEYQGHRNYNAWNVALHLFNDEPTYRLCQKVVEDSAKEVLGSGERNLDIAANNLMALLPPKTPDGVPYTFTNVRLALQHWEG